jgi:hypothetical protein
MGNLRARVERLARLSGADPRPDWAWKPVVTVSLLGPRGTLSRPILLPDGSEVEPDDVAAWMDEHEGRYRFVVFRRHPACQWDDEAD